MCSFNLFSVGLLDPVGHVDFFLALKATYVFLLPLWQPSQQDSELAIEYIKYMQTYVYCIFIYYIY